MSIIFGGKICCAKIENMFSANMCTGVGAYKDGPEI